MNQNDQQKSGNQSNTRDQKNLESQASGRNANDRSQQMQGQSQQQQTKGQSQQNVGQNDRGMGQQGDRSALDDQSSNR
jgi:hypothetical protein